MDRCAIAYEYHKAGFNCAQSVVGAFEDLTGLTREQLMAMTGGFGGGVGGSHAELCGAVSGGVLVLSLLYPQTEANDKEGKMRIYAKAKEFRRRFEEIFGLTRCGELLKARPGVSYSLRAANAKNDERPLFVLVDVVDDEPEARWLSVCFYADMVNDPDELGDFVPSGLMGKDACCLNLEEDDPAMRDYILARLGEAAASAAK